jgi:hypothetical protein
MPTQFDQIGAELGLIRASQLECNWNESLHYCQLEYQDNGIPHAPSPDDDLLHDTYLKALYRGIRPFTSYYAEQWIIKLFGHHFNIQQKDAESLGTISYVFDGNLRDAYSEFSDLVDPWEGDVNAVPFDPEHPNWATASFRRSTSQLCCPNEQQTTSLGNVPTCCFLSQGNEVSCWSLATMMMPLN